MGNYNWIYKELVKSEDDLVGAIAYSLYKRHKIEYIHQCESETGQIPSDEQMTEFHRISGSPTNINNYRNQAEALLSHFLSYATQSIVTEIEQHNKQTIYSELTELLQPIQVEIAKKKGIRQMVFEAVISVFGTIMVLILVGLLLKGYQLISSLAPIP